MHGRQIGIVKGYSYGDEMDRSFERGEIEAVMVPTVERLFAMLAAGRIELIMSNDAVGYELSKKYDRVPIKASTRPINAETFYMGLSKKSPAVNLLPEINRAIEDLRRRSYHCMTTVLGELMADHDGVEPDPLAVRHRALFVFGMLNWIFMWFDPKRDGPLDALGEEMLSLVVHGVTGPRS